VTSGDKLQSPASPLSNGIPSQKAERSGFRPAKPFNAKAPHFANRRKSGELSEIPRAYSGDPSSPVIIDPSKPVPDEHLKVDSKQVKLTPKD
jgi:hypothetical protein